MPQIYEGQLDEKKFSAIALFLTSIGYGNAIMNYKNTIGNYLLKRNYEKQVHLSFNLFLYDTLRGIAKKIFE